MKDMNDTGAMDSMEAKEANQANVEVILATVDYPASKDELVEAANEAEVEEEVVMFFETLPDQQYENSEHVSKTMRAKQEETKTDAKTDAAATDMPDAKSADTMENFED